MPATVRTSVDLPAPLAPSTPSTLPCETSNDTPLSASISRTTRSRRPSRSMVCRRVGLRSKDVRYVTDTSSTRMLRVSEADGKVALPRDEEEGTEHEEPECPGGAQREIAGRRGDAAAQHVAPCRQQRRDRVHVEHPLVALGDLAGEVQDRRQVEPDSQHVWQELREVAEVDLGSRDEHRQAGR